MLLPNRSLKLFLSSVLASVLMVAGITLSTIGIGRSQSVHFSPTERHLIEMIDARESADSLKPYLTDPDVQIAWRAAVGLANLGDTSSRAYLLTCFKTETRDSVSNAEAFAIGMLGPDSAAFQTLANLATRRGSHECWEAIGRVIPANRVQMIGKMAQKTLEHHLVPAKDVADMLVRITLRKLKTEEELAAVDELAMNDDAEARWRAAFIFARTDDSARLAVRIDELSQLLNDLGKPEIRMFAATALGHIHNTAAENILLKAARAETEWRVQVNVMNALSMMPTLDSDVAQGLERIVDISTKDPLTVQPAQAALNAITRMVDAGKLASAKDSAALQEWVHSYAPRFELHSDVGLRVRAMTLPLMARLGSSDLQGEIGDFNNYTDVYARQNCTLAAEVLEDPATFSAVLASIVEYASSPLQQLFRLEALDSLWKKAKKDPKFMQALEEMKFANAYRHMLIRISDLVTEPEIVETALSQIEDSTIIKDAEFKSEAQTYVLSYLTRFQGPYLHDQLLSAIDAAKWLKPKQDSIPKVLEKIYDAASMSGETDIRDSAENAMVAIGYQFRRVPAKKPKRAPIDWSLLESSPDTVLINGDRGTTFIYLYKEEAPLTCLNMIKLMKDGYFSNTLYHRVVPNFVVQSGDKTMSGFGGPGYEIRTEIAPVDYAEAGLLGMASGGKDTEGSQWFINQSPTPHLDGHYTIFGKVIRGMDLIDKVQIGDEIESITRLKHR